jgi:hypothetical protein
MDPFKYYTVIHKSYTDLFAEKVGYGLGPGSGRMMPIRTDPDPQHRTNAREFAWWICKQFSFLQCNRAALWIREFLDFPDLTLLVRIRILPL